MADWLVFFCGKHGMNQHCSQTVVKHKTDLQKIDLPSDFQPPSLNYDCRITIQVLTISLQMEDLYKNCTVFTLAEKGGMGTGVVSYLFLTSD